MQDDDLRERLAALEVEVRYMREAIAHLTRSVETLTGLLAQAKGARLAIGMVLVVAGAVSTYLPGALKWVLAIK